MNRKVIAPVVVVVALAAVGALVLWPDGGGDGLDASGTVEATEADLGFNLPGRIAEVAVREGERVGSGQVLARLDAAEVEARIEQAKAAADAARAVLAELEAGARSEDLSQARSAVRSAEQRAEDAARDLARARRLFEGGAISREALDKAETAATVAEAAADQARQQLSAVRTGPRPERIAAQRAAVAQAEAAVKAVEVQADNAVIRAPFAGRVTIRHREPGEAVQPGQPVVTIMDPDDRWVRIYIPEDRIGAVNVGQPARITSDTFDRAYDGRVTYIAREAEFTPRNVQTKEERVKLVYEVRVAVTGDPDFELKPGVPADVVLGVGPERAAVPEGSEG